MHEEEVQVHEKELQMRKAVIYAIIAISVIVICDVFFFRNIIFTDYMLGNLGDGLFCNLITEHWWQVILGNEGYGLTEKSIKDCDHVVMIPMAAGVDSLNVAAASAVAFWELGKKY